MERVLDAEPSAAMSWESPRPQHRLKLLAAAVIATAIFVVDTLTPLGSAVAVLYVLVIVLVSDAAGRTKTIYTACVCGLMTVASFLWGHGTAAESPAMLRLLFSLAANAVTTALLLKRSDDRLLLEAQARLLEGTSDAVFVRDGDGRIVYWNKGSERLFGWKPQEALGRKFCELFPAAKRTAQNIPDAALLSTGTYEGEERLLARDGRGIDVLTRMRLLPEDGGHRRMVLETCTDVTDRKASERALKDSEHRYRTIFETLAVAIWEHDFRAVKTELDLLRESGVTDLSAYLDAHPDFVIRARGLVRIADVNQTALRMLGIARKEEFFTHLDQFLPPEDDSFRDCMIALHEGHPSFQSEATLRARDGRKVPIIVMLNFPANGAGLDRVQGSIVDMTERRRFQEELDASRHDLEQASRAAMVGEICASVAHEVNQPLAAVTTFAQAAQRWLTREPPNLAEAQEALADVIVSADHASAVVRRVRMLLSNAKSDMGEIALSTVLTETLRLKQKEIAAAGVLLHLDLDARDAIVRGDRVLLQQTFLNVMTNALQAMEATPPDERSLTIRTWREGGDLLLRFADSGPGLGADAGETFFKAFKTTKPNGMGLGLAMCRSIVTAHEGGITLSERQDRRGAVVEIRLPEAARS